MRPACLLLALSLVACYDAPPEFTPASFVDRMRVLGIRAEPPEIAPGETTTLSALIGDPLASARPITRVWLLCDPDPTALLGTACSRMDTARGVSPDMLMNPPPGMRVVPLAHEVEYTAPLGALDHLAPGTLARSRGVVATVMLVVIEGGIDVALEEDAIRQVAIKRIKIAEPGPATNVNPSIERLQLNGDPFAPDVRPQFAPGTTLELMAAASAESRQYFETELPDGRVIEEEEQLLFSWFTTAGAFLSGREFGTRTENADPLGLSLPATDDHVVEVFVVLRDGRGGTDWATRKIRVKR